MRKGESLTRASRKAGVSTRTARKYVGIALSKKRRRWIPRRHDRIPRSMRIYEHGQEQVIIVPDFQTASNIGKYHSIIGRFLDSGDESILREAQRLRYIRDVQGRRHELELRPDVLYRIAERRAEPEFFQIYE